MSRFLKIACIAACVFGGCAEADSAGLGGATTLEQRIDLLTGRALPIQHLGLKSGSSVPPLGDGILPSIGRGGDGAFQVTRVGGWSGGTGAGAIQGHGGQWVIPYSGRAGGTIMNVACDVVPRPDATDHWELTSGGVTIGSFDVPATTAQVIIRGWVILANGYTLADGEAPVFRHSFRGTGGAWTSDSQDMTVIGCAVNATPPRFMHTFKFGAIGGTSVGAGVFQAFPNSGLTGNWYPVNDGDLLGIRLTARVGDRFESVSASVYGNTAYTVQMFVMAQDDAFHGGAQLGNTPTSTAQNTLQLLSVTPLANDNSGNNETVTTSLRDYFLQFRSHKLGAGDGGSLYVGPITLVTSTATP